jgi:hypothetical protein
MEGTMQPTILRAEHPWHHAWASELPPMPFALRRYAGTNLELSSGPVLSLTLIYRFPQECEFAPASYPQPHLRTSSCTSRLFPSDLRRRQCQIS